MSIKYIIVQLKYYNLHLQPPIPPPSLDVLGGELEGIGGIGGGGGGGREEDGGG